MDRVDEEGKAQQKGSFIEQCLAMRSFTWLVNCKKKIGMKYRMNKNNWDKKCIMPDYTSKNA